jgi:hypothetical protein
MNDNHHKEIWIQDLHSAAPEGLRGLSVRIDSPCSDLARKLLGYVPHARKEVKLEPEVAHQIYCLDASRVDAEI